MAKKWRLFVSVIFMLILVLAVSGAATSHLKADIYRNTHEVYRNVSSMIQHTSEIVYLCRKGNIMSFQNQQASLAPIKDRLNVLKGLAAAEKMAINSGSWNASLPSYEVTLDGKVRTLQSNLELVIQNNFLSPLTTYLEQS